MRVFVAAVALFLLCWSWKAWGQDVEAGSGQNITKVLASYGEYSVFQYLLLKTGVAYEINSRSSITVMAPSNKILLPIVQRLDVGVVADILRFQVLLQYLDGRELQQGANTSVTTLYQTTGRAQGDGGIVDVSVGGDGSVGVWRRNAGGMEALLLHQLAAFPYNLSVFDVSTVLIPDGLAQSQMSVNLTDILLRQGSFSTLLSLLASTSLDAVLQNKVSSGLTLFAPNDTVFAATFPPLQFSSLTSQQKVALLKYHVLPQYFPRDYFSLISSHTSLPTLATTSLDYQLSVSPSQPQVLISTGLVSARLADRPIFQDYPLSVFSIDHVLLPTEIFSSLNPDTPSPSPSSPPDSPAAVPELSPSPAPSPLPGGPARSAPPPAAAPAPASASASARHQAPEQVPVSGPIPSNRRSPAAGPSEAQTVRGNAVGGGAVALEGLAISTCAIFSLLLLPS